MENQTLEQKLRLVAIARSFGPMEARAEASRLGLSHEQYLQAVELNRKDNDDANAHYYTTGRAY